MRKVLRIIAISAGIISLVSTVILGFIYLEDTIGYLKTLKNKFLKKSMNNTDLLISDEFIDEPEFLENI